MSEEITPIKKRRGRPPKNQSRVDNTAERPTRTPVSGNRDILTVLGKDPDFVYRWVKDQNESGQRILTFLDAGYAFVQDGDIRVGQAMVYNSSNVGSIIRKPGGLNEYLYLMRVSREWYDEDQATKANGIKQGEEAITRKRDPENQGDNGQYGKNTFL